MAVTWMSPRAQDARRSPGRGRRSSSATAGRSRSVTGSPAWLRRPAPERRVGRSRTRRSSGGVPIDPGGDGDGVGGHDVARRRGGRPVARAAGALDRHRRRPRPAAVTPSQVDVGRRHPPTVAAPSASATVASGAAREQRLVDRRRARSPARSAPAPGPAPRRRRPTPTTRTASRSPGVATIPFTAPDPPRPAAADERTGEQSRRARPACRRSSAAPAAAAAPASTA